MEVNTSTLRTPSIHLIKTFNKVYVFWKSGSLYVAILATLISIVITRILIRVLNHHRRYRSEASSVAVTSSVFDDDFSDLDNDDLDANDDDVSDSSIEDNDECRESDEEVKSKLQRMLSWSDFAKGKSVVKLWDGIGLGLDLNHSSGSLISIYDLDREQRITSIFDKCKFPTPSPSSSVVISANKTSLSAWDSRVSSMGPSVVAEWHGNVVSRGLRRRLGVVTVADTRKAGRLGQLPSQRRGW